MVHLNQDTFRFILENAIMAPSADNHLQFRFQLSENSIRVRYTEAELPPSGSYKRVLALLSLGAVVENLVIAASRFGIGAETVLLPDLSQPNLIMQIRLYAKQTVVDPLLRSIPLRHTNRQVSFRGPSMTDEERRELDATANSFPNCRLVWLDEPALRGQALRLMRQAETERFHNKLLHKELFSAIRFDVGWHKSSAEGMPPAALSVETPLRPIFSLLRHWPVMRIANLFGAHYLMGWRACDLPCRLAPHLGLLAVSHTDNQSVFDVGRSFQRIWLEVTKQGRVLQPMPAAALFALKGAKMEGIPANLQKILAKGWQTTLGEAIPLMLFRTGFAKPTSFVAGRRILSDYIED